MYQKSNLTKTTDRDPSGDIGDYDDSSTLLSYAAINESSIHVDWCELDVGGFQYWSATDASDIGDWTDQDIEDPEEKVLVYPDDLEVTERLWEICSEPVMNYAYPVPDTLRISPSKAAATLYNLPLCVVEIFDREGLWLALTGGGMDLSWETCEAYVRLGYYPPTDFADLPRMANRGESLEDQIVVEACKESFRGARDQRERSIENLERHFSTESMVT